MARQLVGHGASRYRRHKCRCDVCRAAVNAAQKRRPGYNRPGRKRYDAYKPRPREVPMAPLLPCLARCTEVSVVVALEMAAAALPRCPRGTALDELVGIAYLNPGPPDRLARSLRHETERGHQRWSARTGFEAEAAA